jgi:hypothetical protein
MLFPAKARVAVAGLAVAGGAAAAAVLGPAGPAVGQSSPPIQVQIQVNSPATLVAKGAGVNVSVTAGCSATGEFGFVVVGVTESVQKHIAYGFAEDSIPCTGASQTFDLLVTAGSTGPSGIQEGPSKAFAKGVAIAYASIQACSATGPCGTVQVEPIIKIRK